MQLYSNDRDYARDDLRIGDREAVGLAASSEANQEDRKREKDVKSQFELSHPYKLDSEI